MACTSEHRTKTVRVLDTTVAGDGERWVAVPDWANRCEVFVKAESGVTATVEVRRVIPDPELPGSANDLDVRRGTAAVTLSGAAGRTWADVFSVAPGVGEVGVRAATTNGRVRAIISFWRE